MYPYELFAGVTLYDLMIAVGFFAALLYFRIFADRSHFSAALQNLCIVGALCAILGGYGAAVLFQGFYDYLQTGEWILSKQTGATFYGGLIGGAAIFLLIYVFGGALFLKKGERSASFPRLSEIAAGSIVLAHAFGRLGCLFAGCCHGAQTDAWFGIYHVGLGYRVIPMQLFEAIFLFVLATWLTMRLLEGCVGNLGLYLVMYAIWRFFAEFLRADERGASPIPFLSPSQFVAILLLLLGIGLWCHARAMMKEKRQEHESDT